jgi:hypothetical protein
MAWPPQLRELKGDLGVADDRDDVALATVLGAAVEFVEQARGGDFNFTADPASTLPTPTALLFLGTVRLAGRWFNRRRSPDGLIDMGELGATRVPSVDPDIERMLVIGRFRAPMVG